jgi:O-acetylhomoserine (thiol)-lyase
MKKQTIAIHTSYVRPDAYGALAVPIYNNVSFEFQDAQEMSDAFCNRIKAPDYARIANPTVTQFEQRVKALTEAEHVTAFNSGMAAISTALLAAVAQGKSIVTSHHLFGNTLALISGTLLRLGIKPRLRDLTDLEAVEQAIDEQTACVFLEIVTNPQLEVADLKAIADIAHRKSVPVIADSTVIPFTETNLKALGVDVEVVSSTKYISGGGTSLGGLIIDYGTFPQINQRVKYDLLINLGVYMTPQTAYMQTLGLETLDVRYQRQAANALWLAKALREVKGIESVNYVGLEDNPYHALAQQQFGPTAGAMLTIDLASKEACFTFLNRLKLIHRATNLFDSRTLAIHPASTIFGLFPERQLQQMDVRQTTIRLSVGLEAAEDILADIEQALENLKIERLKN